MIRTLNLKKIFAMLFVALLLFGGSSVVRTEWFHAAGKSEAESSAAQLAKLVNINQAGSEELQNVRGIGPAIAERIIQYRNDHGRFERLEDLSNVNGIGKAKLEKIKSQVSI